MATPATHYVFQYQLQYGENDVRKPVSISVQAENYDDAVRIAQSEIRQYNKTYSDGTVRTATLLTDTGQKMVQSTATGTTSSGQRVKSTQYVPEGTTAKLSAATLADAQNNPSVKTSNVITDPVTGKQYELGANGTYVPVGGSTTSGVITDNVTGKQYVLGAGGKYVPYVGSATPPSNIGNTNTGFTSTNLPSNSPSFGNISSAAASTSGMSALLDSLVTQQEAYQKQIQEAEKNQAKQTSGLMDWLKKQPTQVETRQDAMGQTGINPTQYFAEERAKIQEIDALTQEYNGLVAAKDQAIAQSYDKMASNSFINNQISQIERNAAPRLNQLSSNINSKAAVLQAIQGRFAEAQQFADQAVNDAIADQKFQLDLFSTFYQINQDNISRLDTKYKNALDNSLAIAQQEYETARDEKKQMVDMIMDAATRGVDLSGYLTGSYDALLNAYGSRVSSAEGTSGTGVTSGFKNTSIEADVRADSADALQDVRAGAVTLQEAYDDLRIRYSPSEVSDTALQGLLGISSSPVVPGTASTGTSARTNYRSQQIETDIASLKRVSGLTNSDVRSELRKKGYTNAEINASSAYGTLDAITHFLFQE